MRIKRRPGRGVPEASRRRLVYLVMVAALILLFGIGIASAATAIKVTRAELDGT